MQLKQQIYFPLKYFLFLFDFLFLMTNAFQSIFSLAQSEQIRGQSARCLSEKKSSLITISLDSVRIDWKRFLLERVAQKTKQFCYCGLAKLVYLLPTYITQLFWFYLKWLFPLLDLFNFSAVCASLNSLIKSVE